MSYKQLVNYAPTVVYAETDSSCFTQFNAVWWDIYINYWNICNFKTTIGATINVVYVYSVHLKHLKWPCCCPRYLRESLSLWRWSSGASFLHLDVESRACKMTSLPYLEFTLVVTSPDAKTVKWLLGSPEMTLYLFIALFWPNGSSSLSEQSSIVTPVPGELSSWIEAMYRVCVHSGVTSLASVTLTVRVYCADRAPANNATDMHYIHLAAGVT